MSARLPNAPAVTHISKRPTYTPDNRVREGASIIFHDLAITMSLLTAIGAATTWMAHRRCHQGTRNRVGIWDVVKTWVEGRTRIAMERERRITTLETLNLITTGPPDTPLAHHETAHSRGDNEEPAP